MDKKGTGHIIMAGLGKMAAMGPVRMLLNATDKKEKRISKHQLHKQNKCADECVYCKQEKKKEKPWTK